MVANVYVSSFFTLPQKSPSPFISLPAAAPTALPAIPTHLQETQLPKKKKLKHKKRTKIRVSVAEGRAFQKSRTFFVVTEFLSGRVESQLAKSDPQGCPCCVWFCGLDVNIFLLGTLSLGTISTAA